MFAGLFCDFLGKYAKPLLIFFQFVYAICEVRTDVNGKN